MLKGLNKKAVFAAIIGFFLVSTVTADLSGDIRSIIGSKTQAKTTFAIRIVKASTGKILYEKNSTRPMIPASNMKVITSAAAVHYLGSDYQFETTIGLLDESLVVIGRGDPLLGDKSNDSRYGRGDDWIFVDILSALKEKNISKLNDIIIDRAFFDDNRVHPSWPVEQLNNWYACEVSGLNYNDNCVHIVAQNIQGRIRLQVDPVTNYVHLVNEVVPTTKGDSAVGAYRNTQPNKLIVKGKCNRSAGFDVAIERPAAFFGFMLGERLSKEGISVNGKLIEKYITKKDKIDIIRIYKTPFADVLIRCNKNSLNLAAEALVKTISAENTKGRINGEWAHGKVLIGKYLKSLGIDQTQFKLDDGSGLSRLNKLSPYALTTVLLDMYSSKDSQFYIDSLAVGGMDGTISKYFSDEKYKDKIFGKTGYISGVRSFSGICRTGQGDVIFSILTEGGNGYTRSAINDITKAVIDNLE